MKKIYILSTIWMAFIVGACDYNDKNFDGLDDIVKPAMWPDPVSSSV